nr:DNA-directed DNA polymerase [Tanacetum cinerariifolium]
MRTRSQSRNNFPQQEASPAIVERLRIELPFLEDQFQEDPPEDPPEVPMADNRTMAELLQVPSEGYEDAIVIPEIAANNFELKHASPAIVKPLRIELPFLEDQFQEDSPEDPPEVLMADNRTMAELLQAPIEGYEDAIVIPEIAASNFELKHGLINLVQNKQFFKHDKEDPRAHIRYFNKITSTMRIPNVPSSSIKLMLFLFSLEGEAQIWLEKESPRSILNWDDLVSKFINQFFPLSKTTNLHNEITRFQQRFDESFYEAWDRFNDLFRACPHHGFFELHQLDTFYNALNAVVAKVSTSSSTPAISSDVAEHKDMVRALLLDKKNQSSAPSSSSTPTPVKAVEPNYVTCGGAHSYQNCPATNRNVYRDNIQEYMSQAATANYNQGNTSFRPQMVANQIRAPVFEPIVAPVSALMPNVKPSIRYPSRRDNERRRDQANEQIEKFYEIFKDMSFEISFTDALILMPKFASTLKALIGNKEKLREMARTPMNEHCLAVILNKLPRKLGDPEKFLIPCEFPGMDECLALADLGASINLMPLSVWEALSLPELTLTCMTLELADRLVSKPLGIAKHVSVKVGVFHFQADFVVVDFEPDPRVPLILGRCFLKTGRALIDVHKGELTHRMENEAITYNLDQTSRYSANYNQLTANKNDIIDIACEEYSQEVLGFSDVTASGNPTPYDDPIVSITEPLPPLPNHEQDMPSFKKELKVCEAKTVKSSVDEPPEVELKDLPPHLEYAFMEGDNKLPVIIAKELGDEEKSALIKVLKFHKRAIAWKLSDIQEVEKLLVAGLIYPISDSPWVSPVHYVPKKGGFTVVENEENKLILTRLVTGWRVCIDYQKLNEATHKDHIPMPFMDQMLKRLAGNEYYCFLDGFLGCMLAIFNDMVEKTIEVFMDDFLVFGNSFENCLSRLDKMLQRCEDTNLCLNWEKSHFMVKEALSSAIRFIKTRLRLTELKLMSLLNYLIPQLSKVFGVFSVMPVSTDDSFRIFLKFLDR